MARKKRQLLDIYAHEERRLAGHPATFQSATRLDGGQVRMP